MTLYNSSFENFNKNYFGAVSLAIIVQSCLGGAAAMFVLSNGTSFMQMFQLTLIVMVCMIVNTSILAQIGHKIIFNSIITSVILSAVLIFINSFII